MPEKMVRSSKPKSKLNLSNLLLPSTFSQLSTLATRKSTFMKSSNEHVSATGSKSAALAAFSSAALASATACLLFSINLSICSGSMRCIKWVYLLIAWPAGKVLLASDHTKAGVFKNSATAADNLGNTGLKYTVRMRKALMSSEQTCCKRASWPSCLANSHGLLASTYSLTTSVKAITSRKVLAYSRSS